MDMEKIKGIVPPAVTPLTAKGELDREGLSALVEHFMAAGVHGIFMMGSTGEAYVLPDAVRQAAVVHAAESIGGRAPLYVGIADNSLERTLANADRAADCGAEVLVVMSPPYLDYSRAEQAQYFRKVADHASLPVLLYNIPQWVKNPIDEKLLAELISYPNIVGIKDSEGDAPKSTAMRALLRDHPQFRWFEGNDSLAAQSLLMGAHGLVNGGMNIFPGLYVAIYDAVQAGDLEAARSHHGRLMDYLKMFRIDRTHSSFFGSFVKITKFGLQQMGICKEYLSFPFEPLGKDSRERVERFLADWAE